MMASLRTYAAIGPIALMLGACSLMPNYERPAAPVPASFPTGSAYGVPAGTATASTVTADAIGWREMFLDPTLQRLIETALTNNRDLRAAAINVELTEAQYRAQRGGLFPAVGASAGADYSRTPGSVAGRGGGAVKGETYSAGTGFTSFELDLFGRVRSLTAAAFERYLASDENRRAVQISLVAQVATTYLTLIADQELLALTRQTLASQEDSLRVTQAAADAGAATDLTLAQARSAVETARANHAQYTRQVAQDENALALLLGEPIPAGLRVATLDAPLLMADIPAGLSSEVLLRRPDVLAAEYNLRAANADIGAARAAFFPSISLTGSYGTAAGALSGLFAAGSLAWSFIPQVSIPIFTGGTNQANLDATRAQNRIQIANYEKAIQTAFRETADALAARGTYGDQIQAQEAVTAAFADSYRLSELRFRSGVDNYLVTLDSQRSLYAAQQNLIVLRRDRLANLATLYKVLGGGWQ